MKSFQFTDDEVDVIKFVISETYKSVYDENMKADKTSDLIYNTDVLNTLSVLKSIFEKIKWGVNYVL